jgi:methylmalonyl-CoA mutase
VLNERTVVRTLAATMSTVAVTVTPPPNTSAGDRPRNKVRVVTAAALFDGHDAAINVMRRILQAHGAEVIHLGHNRGAEEVVDAAIQEDAQAIAVSSYQGGHMEFFKYMHDLLRQKGAPHITIWGGGGGVIVPREIDELHSYGINRIFSPEDGRRHGLDGMIKMILDGADFSTAPTDPLAQLHALRAEGGMPALASLITVLEDQFDGRTSKQGDALLRAVESADAPRVPVLGLTGTGGAGKSSLTDELVARFARENPERRIAVISVDPTRRRTGGALLGDRIRMNSIRRPNVFMRSMATRSSGVEISAATVHAVKLCKLAGYQLILVETSGIGQADAAIDELADVCVYVMTSEYGAQSQLEKIEMLDVADFVAINKFEHKGSKDALRDVRKQVRRNRNLFHNVSDEQLPVFGTVASRFNDSGVNGLYAALCQRLSEVGEPDWVCQVPTEQRAIASDTRDIITPNRIHYLAEVVHTVHAYKAHVERQIVIARQLEHLRHTRVLAAGAVETLGAATLAWLDEQIAETEVQLTGDSRQALALLPKLRAEYAADEYVVRVRQSEVRYPTHVTTLSDSRIPRVALPHDDEPGATLRYMLLEGPPGHFPFTGGVFPFKREGEDPKRMFAGEGGPARTNARFKFLSEGEPAKRLSTAFDSVTLYGWDPEERPDVWGKIGESGVSVCTLDDAKELYGGFDLCAPTTSVSMTINGPAPIILAFYMNAAIDQQVEGFTAKHGRAPSPAEYEQLRDFTLAQVRGTVQADILKEDQGQNTCIFSIEFALRMMGDIQEYFIRKRVQNYYSVSISGYHIAEAGANPISQLAFTLANGFTYVEYYRSRGMEVNEFARNLSFFFSNGLDAEYTVIGRVARRIWAIAMRDLYGADDRSQKFKYHIQTSGRSLHAMEIDFNDIRTTLQALFAYYDHCNSLHTNAYDEAITTPTEASVRRAMAIQLIITNEQGLAKNENPLQGSYIVEQLTELVEEAVLDEFLRIDERGGVLGAMERQYQRGKIQDESLKYERLKHTGELPIVGVNTFQNPSKSGDEEANSLVLTRASADEKNEQIRRLRAFQERHAAERPAALERLAAVALAGGNIFECLMDVARVCSLGEISRKLFEVGGEYRRNM